MTMSTTNETKTNATIFRPADADKRTAAAASVRASATAAVKAARAEVDAAEAAAVESPDEKSLQRTRAARTKLDAAERDLEIANRHSAKVDADIASAEQAAVEKKIAQLEASQIELVDDALLDAAVELSLLSLNLHARYAARIEQRRNEVAALNELRKKTGAAIEDAAAFDRIASVATLRLHEVALSAQAQELKDKPINVGPCWPLWRGGNGVEAVVTGVERFRVIGATGDGTPITMGRDRRQFAREVSAVLERVKAKRAEPSGGSSLARVAGAVSAVAPVLALATAASLLLANG
jgi:hypothetical protein